MSPMAMPAAGFLSGTPASIMESDDAHTVAIEDDPFEDIISETTRIV